MKFHILHRHGTHARQAWKHHYYIEKIPFPHNYIQSWFNHLIQSYEIPFSLQIFICHSCVFENFLKLFCENIWRFQIKSLPLHSLLRSNPDKAIEIGSQGWTKVRKLKILLKILQLKNFDLTLQNLSASKFVLLVTLLKKELWKRNRRTLTWLNRQE